MTRGYVIRPLDGVDEYRACVDLQEETWGRGFSERVAPAILKVSQILGGVASGAWDDEGRLVGFVFGMTGPRDGVLVHWSDMLAVHPGLRNAGLGRALKLHQRELVMARGVTTMHWTFDPLRSRNAHLNFARLGIVAREYAVDMYGQTDSPLHRGIGTDRLVALWALDSDRVARRLAGTDPLPAPDSIRNWPAVLTAESTGGPHPRPGTPSPAPDAPRARIEVPPDIQVIMDDDPDLARAWRQATRQAFSSCLDRGWVVDDFVRDSRTPTYLLSPSDPRPE